MSTRESCLRSIEFDIARILACLDPDSTREGLERTPTRVAESLYDELLSGYRADLDTLFTTFDDGSYDQMVVLTDVPFYSMCEHHMLPFFGKAHVGYIPGTQKRIVGISKIARVIDIYARRLQVQERLTQQIGQCLVDYLGPSGVIVVLEAEHLCMTMRGVQKPGSTTITSALFGILRDDPSAKSEFLQLIGR